MRKNFSMFFAKLLIFFSILFIIGGVGLLVLGNEFFLHPIYDVSLIENSDSENISITTLDSDEVIEPITESEIIDPSTIINNGFQQNNNLDSNIIQENVEPTIEEVNAQLRMQIQDTYGVTIKYANETNGYSIGGMSTIEINDPVICQAALINLNNALSLYPTGFFQEISNKGYPLTFYLIKRYSTENVTGVTDSTYNNIIISIATDYDFSNTFHHEIYHYIEKYIFSTGFRFTSWTTLNPGDFDYGTINSNYSYAKTFSEDSYFVNSYAMTDEYEDRASTFEYMMKSNKATCLNYGKTVWLKARTMSEQIDYHLDSVMPNVTEYWERHVY